MYHMYILIVMSCLIEEAILYHCCKDYDVCSLFQQRMPQRHAETTKVLLAESVNGCSCKVYSNKYVECSEYSCQEIPRNLNLTVSELRIISTSISVIQENEFANYSGLTELLIDNHKNLETIEGYAFHTLTQLTNISISFNAKLKFLNAKTFVGLAKLRELYLVRNGFTSIAEFSPALSPKYLPSLYELVLMENIFINVTSSDFEPMEKSPVKILNVASCKLHEINSHSLNHLTQLENLIIGRNCIGAQIYTNLITNLTKANNSLKNLNLYEIDLKTKEIYELLKAISYSDIECLSLESNKIEFINNNTFPKMENIKFLNLRNNEMKTITKDAFTHFTNLQTMILSENNYAAIPQGTLLENLTYLDVSAASRDNTYLTVNEHIFENMSALQVLNLAFNKLGTLYNLTFAGLSNLDSLSLEQCSISTIIPGCFLPLRKLRFLNLENNRFTESESRVLDMNLFEGLDNLQVLLLSGNKISYLSDLTFSSLKSLTYLSLNDNKISHLEFSFFQTMNRLNTIDLEKNSVSSWHENFFGSFKNLTNVYLGNNKITSFNGATLDDIAALGHIDLSHNNFICDCELYQEFEQLEDETYKSVSSVLQKASALCFPSGMSVQDYLLDPEICKLDLTGIVIGVAITFGFIALTGFFIYYHRWNLRYYIFLMKLYFQRKDDKVITEMRGCCTNYIYDAFVSYSNEDSHFISRLISTLENSEPHLKLCVYERDFDIGSVISESIVDSVIKSRKVLLVVSNNYAKSQWCLWETHIAQHCNLFLKEDGLFNDNTLILIKLEKVNRRYLTPTLKYLLKTKIYLEWDENEEKEDIFWKKLKENIGHCHNGAVAVTRF